MQSFRKVLASILIISMVSTTGGFVTLADSISDIVETFESESSTELSHKYYDEITGETLDESEADEPTSDAVGENLDEPEEDVEASDDIVANDAIVGAYPDNRRDEHCESEEPENDEPTSSENSDTTTKTTTEIVVTDETIIENPESENNVLETENIATESDAGVNADELNEDAEPDDNNVGANLNNVGAKLSEPTDISTISDAQVATDIDISTVSDAFESDIATFSEIFELDIATKSTLQNLTTNLASISEINLASLSEINLASLSEITVATMSFQTNLYGAGPLQGGIWFGTYPQNDVDGVQYEPIRWYVKNQSDTEALLIAEYILDNVSFDNYFNNTWETSYIRNWLNGEFKNRVFTTEQQNGIVDKYLTTVGSNPTYDKIFLLSSHEANTFLRQRNTDDFWDLGEIRGRGTTYAINVNNNGGTLTEISLEGGKFASIYWVRDKQGKVGTIYPHYRLWDGDTEMRLLDPWDRHAGVRPALYVNLNSDIFKTSDNAVSFDLVGGSWKSGSTMWQYFDRYQGGQILPTVANINGPNGAKLIGWVCSDAPDTVITEIAPDKTGDISLKAKYKFDITWDLQGGEWNGIVGSASYIYRDNYVLPTNITPPTGKFFDHWEINDELVTSITSEDYGDKTIKAVYGTLPAYIWLGTYPQNDIEGTQSEPVKWSVLTQNGSEALLMADKIIDSKRYNENYSPVTWDNSDVRTWLKGDFKNKIFTTEQFDNILINKTISTTEGGASVTTNDKVILLSSDDADNYFIDNSTRRTSVTPYSGNIMSIAGDANGPWWLRGRGTGDYNTRYISANGAIDYSGREVNTDGIGIRPAIYVDLSKQLIRTSKNSVTWHLNGGSWEQNSVLWQSFDKYQVGQKLPTADNIVEPTDGEFLGWTYESNSDDVVTEIALDKKGDITLEAKYRYNITWDLHDGALGPEGSWAGTVGPDHYVNGVGIPNLPTNVNGPSDDRVFDHWEIDGTTVTSVTASDYGAKTIKAVYKYYVPDYIWFGTYPQNDKSGIQYEPIKWKVLNTNSNEAFLVSDKILAKKNYNDERIEITWEDSTIRNWLNGDFKNTAFTTAEVGGIVDKTIQTPGQDDTTDKIFLLSKSEAETYFSSNAERTTTSTKYGTNDSASAHENMFWYLRDSGVNSYFSFATCVTNSGSITNFFPVNSGNFIGARPALCFNLNSTIFKKQNHSINFDLDGGSFKTESALWNEITTYQGGLKLPTSDNINNPIGKEFAGWSLVGETATISEISATTTGNVDLIANYKNAHYKLTFDMGEGHLIATPSEYEYSVGMLLPVSTDVVPPVGRAFSHWEIDGVAVRDITTTDYGDKVLKAIYSNIIYNITFDMGEGHLVSTPSGYEYSVGLTLPASTEVVPPRGRSFDHWEIDGNTVTSITTTDYEDKVVVAKYTNNRYTITWDYTFLGREWSFVSGVNPPVEYEYGTGTALPGDSDVDEPRYILDEWFIYNNETDELTWGNSIDANYVGNVTLSAGFRPDTFNITYKNEDNTDVIWSGTAGPSQYTYHTGIPLLPTNVDAPANKEFDHWEIDGNEVSEIGYEEYGDKEVIAIYRNTKFTITWNLSDTFGRNGDWVVSEEGANEYTFGVGYTLPATSSVIAPPGMYLDYWTIDGVTPVTEISAIETGDKIISAIYHGIEYSIDWDLKGAQITGWAIQTSYMYGDVYTASIPLPTSADVTNLPTGKSFSHWEVNGVRATEIAQGTMGDLVVSLIFTDTPTYNITWNYGSGDNAFSFNGWIAPATFSEGTAVVFPDASFVNVPNGRELEYFTVNGTRATEISSSIRSDVVVSAVLKNKTYRIRYILGEGSWDGVAGNDAYTHGTSYTLPTNVTAGRGREFVRWTIGGIATTSIPASDYGHKEFTAVYGNKTYNINWVLKDATIDTALTPATYAYGTAVSLPASTNITPATGFTFNHWEIDGRTVTEIAAGTIGDITVTLMYNSSGIVWQLGGGRFRNYTAPNQYEIGIGLTLPDADKVQPPNGYLFSYFTVNGIRSTSIPTTATGIVVVKAIYVERPEPTPVPDYPSGGGGGNHVTGNITSGGPGAVNYVNQIKTIKAAPSADQIVWVYDPISNKFKMNINFNGASIPATDGFYIIRKMTAQTNAKTTEVVEMTDTYYFDNTGSMVTGWIQTLDNKWYFTIDDKNIREGQMVFGWYNVHGTWYYFTADGSMLVNDITPDGYQVGADGAWVQK